MKTTQLLNTRQFLNRDKGLLAAAKAFVSVSLGMSSYNKKPPKPCSYSEIDLTISDCSRSVHLAFDIDTDVAYQQALHKVDVLLHMLTQFRAALVKAKALADNWKKKK